MVSVQCRGSCQDGSADTCHGICVHDEFNPKAFPQSNMLIFFLCSGSVPPFALTFPADSPAPVMPLAALVGTGENDVVEGVDVRAVVLASGDPGVDVQTPPGELRIRDNDGEGVLSSGGRGGGGGGLDVRAVVLTSGDPGVDVETPPGELRIRDNDGEGVLSGGWC